MHTIDAGRRAHYADFYEAADAPPGERLGVILGNCQAESLRIALAATDVRFLRIPPVHELTGDDMPHLERVLQRVDVLITQPIHDDYHDLPLGSAQVTARSSATQTVQFPVIRFAGLYPWHVLVRPPDDPGATPPIVPYHDISLLMRLANLTPPARLSREAVTAITAESTLQLQRREHHHGTVVISDLFAEPSFAHMRTINHPGNPVFETLAQRISDAVDLGAPPQPLPRQVLTNVHAPRDARVIDVFGLDCEPTDWWTVDGREVSVAEVHAAHTEWYRAHPAVIAAGIDRFADIVRLVAL